MAKKRGGGKMAKSVASKGSKKPFKSTLFTKGAKPKGGKGPY